MYTTILQNYPSNLTSAPAGCHRRQLRPYNAPNKPEYIYIYI